MATPGYVPSSIGDRPTKATPIPGHDGWTATRPADLKGSQPVGPRLGRPGPDQGYALTLARRLQDRLVVLEDESRDDAVAGCLGVALRRAAMYGRAPVIYDLELAFTLWGFLGGAPDDLVAYRKPLFESARHHYWSQREIVDRVPDDTLRLTPAQVRERLGDWKNLIRTD